MQTAKHRPEARALHLHTYPERSSLKYNTSAYFVSCICSLMNPLHQSVNPFSRPRPSPVPARSISFQHFSACSTTVCWMSLKKNSSEQKKTYKDVIIENNDLLFYNSLLFSSCRRLFRLHRATKEIRMNPLTSVTENTKLLSLLLCLFL